ncbi:MAG: GGDEF domain-containing protein [Rhizobiaceae bacterium]
MTSAGYILAINLFIAGLFAAAFLSLAAYDRDRRSARWLAASFLIGMVYFAVEFSIPLFSDARLPVTTAFAVFLFATVAFNMGLSRKYQTAFHWPIIAVFAAAATALVYASQDLPRNAPLRMLAYQAPYALMQFTAAAIVLSSARRRAADLALAALLVLSALQFLSKPVLAHMLGGWGENPQAYINSPYAMASQAIGSIFAVAVALAILIIVVRDVMAEATEKSQRDALSGLLNRAGFELQAGAALAGADARGAPVSLVLSDLDHFKAVNDTFGHAAGDRAIATFASFLRSHMAPGHVAGRIGGEEFAILLPGANLGTARLFAEGARSAIAARQVVGIPKDWAFTASFGVAERVAGEAIADLLARADLALYEAKNEGRNCVRVAARPFPRRVDLGRPA